MTVRFARAMSMGTFSTDLEEAAVNAPAMEPTETAQRTLLGRRIIGVAVVAAVGVSALFAVTGSFPWQSDNWQSQWLFGDYPAPEEADTSFLDPSR